MAIVSAIYGLLFESAFAGLIDFTSETTIKAGFTLVGYVPNLDTDQYWNAGGDPQSFEHAATGNYTTGGFVLTSTAVAYTASGNIFTLDAADVSVASSTISNVRSVVVYENTGLFPLICYNLSDADISTTGGTFSVTWAGNGIVRIEVGAEA